MEQQIIEGYLQNIENYAIRFKGCSTELMTCKLDYLNSLNDFRNYLSLSEKMVRGENIKRLEKIFELVDSIEL